MRRIIRWLRATLIAVAALIVLAVGAVYGLSERKLRKTYEANPAPLVIPTDSVSLAHGEHLARAVGNCTLCHGDDAGGKVYIDMGPMGRIVGPNLTRGRGGVGAERTTEDWVRAIRYGVKRDGTSLIVMPSEVFAHFSDADLAAIIGYLQSRPPVDRELPETRFGPLGRAFLAAGKMNILVAPKTPRLTPESVPAGATAEYGKYLADVSGCHGCHGFGLSGGRVAGPPGLPPASNLTPAGAIGSWTEADFARVLREGKRPGDVPVDEFMPWKTFRYMTDDEIHALWLYLKSVKAKEFGNK